VLSKKILVIGAGERRVEDAIHHDVQDLPGIDLVGDFWDLPKLAKDKYDEIHMTHVLEHFPMKKVPEVLALVKSLLNKPGRLYIEVPNFYWHALGIISNPKDRKMVEYAFGGQLNEWDFHYNGFTPEILHEDLMEAGFVVDELRPNSSIECWASV
jgi:predicted SAM-dependent methyltransferase